jgi:AcrR family transcriptional regulator
MRLFREKGFRGTSINDIGAAAGVTGPALYRHFSGKGEVLTEAIREVSRRIAAATREATQSECAEPRQTLEVLVRAYVEVALANADVYAAYVLEARHLEPESRRSFRRSELRHRDDWKRLVTEVHPTIDAKEASTMVTMAIFAIASLCMETSRLERAAQVEMATTRVMALLLAPPLNAAGGSAT